MEESESFIDEYTIQIMGKTTLKVLLHSNIILSDLESAVQVTFPHLCIHISKKMMNKSVRHMKGRNIEFARKDGYQIYVRSVQGKTEAFDIKPDSTAQTLKEDIYARWGSPPELQRLIYCGKQLEDDLDLWGWESKPNPFTMGSTLVMAMRMRGD